MTVESRIFSVAEYVQPSEGEPIRSVVLETRDSIIVVWHVHPGQEIAAHIHPHGQDTWTVLSGMADYFQGHCCKVSDEAAFCLIQRPYISKTLLT
ncbi:cupin domain-containing protein, partial [Escherichia coli]|uniref:cupin domain-containing protein n=1 Tax=Escherichia coli TaxID=562 RepID=UPI00203B354C